MKKIVLIAIILPLLFSCSKKWDGCTDYVALNFKEIAEKDDGSCIYTTLTFYADSANYPVSPVDYIDVSVQGSGLGVFSKVYSVGGPADCNAEGTLNFSFEDAGKITWISTVHLVNGTSSSTTGVAVPDSSQTCILIKVL